MRDNQQLRPSWPGIAAWTALLLSIIALIIALTL